MGNVIRFEKSLYNNMHYKDVEFRCRRKNTWQASRVLPKHLPIFQSFPVLTPSVGA